MVSASLYVMACSARNRLRVRLRRLKEPRYLLGAMAGAAYLYFSVFARVRSGRAARRSGRTGPRTAALFQALGATIAPLGAILLLAVGAVSWILPVASGLLEFSEAEIAFLFPAPVSRRQLLVHRMIRSQLGMLFSAIVLGVAFPSGGGFSRLHTALSMWVLLFTGRLYFTGVTLARRRMRSADPVDRRLGWLPAILVAGAVAVVGWALSRGLTTATSGSALEALDRIAAAATEGAAGVVLWPLLALVRPLFIAEPWAFARAIGWSLVVCAAALGFVLAGDAAFEDAAADIADRRVGATPAAASPQFRARATGVSLALAGRPEPAFAWKGLLQTLRIIDRPSLARLVAIVLSLTIAAVSMGRANGFAAMLGVFATMGAGFAILVGPQALRMDLRQDLLHLELLKTWPVAPAAIVRGEILWPATLLTALAWSCLGIALFLSAAVFGGVGIGVRAAIAAAIGILAPALIFAQYTIHNGVALMFPAWVPLGSGRPRGFDAMGQRLILLGGAWLLLAAAALPGAVAGGVVWLGCRPWLGVLALVLAAAAASGVLAVEVLVASEALGPAFDRVDVSAVERSE